jgi:hypothetical protein
LKVGVVEYLEGHTDGNTLVGCSVDWNCTRPQKHRGVEGIALVEHSEPATVLADVLRELTLATVDISASGAVPNEDTT